MIFFRVKIVRMCWVNTIYKKKVLRNDKLKSFDSEAAYIECRLVRYHLKPKEKVINDQSTTYPELLYKKYALKLHFTHFI